MSLFLWLLCRQELVTEKLSLLANLNKAVYEDALSSCYWTALLICPSASKGGETDLCAVVAFYLTQWLVPWDPSRISANFLALPHDSASLFSVFRKPVVLLGPRASLNYNGDPLVKSPAAVPYLSVSWLCSKEFEDPCALHFRQCLNSCSVLSCLTSNGERNLLRLASPCWELAIRTTPVWQSLFLPGL